MMTMTRITIPVSVEEREALRRLAKQQLRDPREQARHIIRCALLDGIVAGATPISDIDTIQQCSLEPSFSSP